MRALIRIVIWIASIGWLFPTYFAISFYLGYQRADIQHQIYHGSPEVCSFPFLAMSREMFGVAFPWFSIVLAGWVGYATIRATAPRKNWANQRPDGTPVKSPPSNPGQVSGVPHP